jgi:hypothetical protein
VTAVYQYKAKLSQTGTDSKWLKNWLLVTDRGQINRLFLAVKGGDKIYVH